MMLSTFFSSVTARALKEVVVYWFLTLFLTITIHLIIQETTLNSLFQLNVFLSIRDSLSSYFDNKNFDLNSGSLLSSSGTFLLDFVQFCSFLRILVHLSCV